MFPLRRLQVGLESYKEWIQLVADFTISSLNSWQWASGSVYHLLGLWWMLTPACGCCRRSLISGDHNAGVHRQLRTCV